MSPPPTGPSAKVLRPGSWVPGFGAALSITTMWLAVLLDGIFGSDMAFTSSPTNVTTMPPAVAVALFAVIGTSAVAKRALRSPRERMMVLG